jgi:hypothetical protein
MCYMESISYTVARFDKGPGRKGEETESVKKKQTQKKMLNHSPPSFKFIKEKISYPLRNSLLFGLFFKSLPYRFFAD